MTAIIEVNDLTVIYGSLRAVNHVTLDIHEAEIFGMIGPNGAGKTTIIECIEGLRDRYSGSIQVLGLNPKTDRRALYQRIGIHLQETSYPEKIKVWEICDLFSLFYPNPLPYNELLSEFGLDQLEHASVSKLSGGERQKLSVILSLIPQPDIIFLDELTTGLDPQARRTMWEVVKGLKAKGITVFLTTHFMDEAEYLCDRVAIVNKGEIVALDTVNNLIRSFALPDKIQFTASHLDPAALATIAGVERIEKNGDDVTLYGSEQAMLAGVVNYLQANGITYDNLRVVRPSLEDVFLSITGARVNNHGDIQ